LYWSKFPCPSQVVFLEAYLSIGRYDKIQLTGGCFRIARPCLPSIIRIKQTNISFRTDIGQSTLRNVSSEPPIRLSRRHLLHLSHYHTLPSSLFPLASRNARSNCWPAIAKYDSICSMSKCWKNLAGLKFSKIVLLSLARKEKSPIPSPLSANDIFEAQCSYQLVSCPPCANCFNCRPLGVTFSKVRKGKRAYTSSFFSEVLHKPHDPEL
jgi:hypothetical protein